MCVLGGGGACIAYVENKKINIIRSAEKRGGGSWGEVGVAKSLAGGGKVSSVKRGGLLWWGGGEAPRGRQIFQSHSQWHNF